MNTKNSEPLCLNCDKEVDGAKLFCSEACADEAKFVRYVRRCNKDGRAQFPDVKEAIEIRLSHILAGGYPEHERQISATLRATIIARDSGRCQNCGLPGNQIDHIKGSGNTLDNLQLLCRSCHNQKTRTSMVVIEAGSLEWERCNAKIIALLKRINSIMPERICDDDVAWPSSWRAYFQERKLALVNHR